MNYGQARAYAVNVSRSGSILGLDSIENLMHELGDIQEQLKIIHIAGTNGKGSTGAYLERVLIEAGYRVGRYSSPAVFDPMEVWRINLQSMSHEEYADIMEQVKCACDRMVEKGMEHPTIFEVETAMAFLYFYQKKCDYVLLEVGMGGRTDATNLIKSQCAPLLHQSVWIICNFLKYTDRDCTGKSRHYQKRLSGRDHPAKSRGNGGDRSRGGKTARKALYRRCFQGNGGNRNVKRDQIRSSGTWNGDNPAYRDISGGKLLSGGHSVKGDPWNCRPDHYRRDQKYRVAGQV